MENKMGGEVRKGVEMMPEKKSGNYEPWKKEWK